MHKKGIKIAARLYLVISLLFSNLIYAAPFNPTLSNKIPLTKEQIQDSVISKQNKDSQSLTSSQFGWSGPFTFGVSHDSLFNYTWNAQYTQVFNDSFALSGLVEYGSNMYRYGATAGLKLYENNYFKVTGERLSQILPFTFDSGSVNERVAQNAVGARYERNFANKYWQNFSLGGYYSKAENRSLDPVYFTFDGMNAVNYRYLAGATSSGADIGSAVNLTKSTAILGRLFYDDVHYNTKYSGDSQYDAKGLGWSLGINQLVGKRLIIGAEAGDRKIYGTYKFSVSWLPPKLSNLGLELSVLGQHLVSHNQTPNSNSIGLKIGFNPSVFGSDEVQYQLPTQHTPDKIGEWTSVPAVHMEQVLVVADQQTKILSPVIISASPASGPVAGGTVVTITGSNFIGTTGVTFGGVPAASFKVTSPTTLLAAAPAHVAGPVDLVIIHPGGSVKTTFTYTTVANVAPIIAGISPAIGLPGKTIHAVISGKNFEQGASVNVGSQAAIVEAVTAEKIVVTIPENANVSGKVDVTVNNPDGTIARLPGGFTYFDTHKGMQKQSAPVNALAVSPLSGPNAGGNTVTISGGSGFTAATTVTVTRGSVSKPATVTAVDPSGTWISFTMPAHGTGLASITTVNPAYTLTNVYYYHNVGDYTIVSSAGSGGTITPLGYTQVRSGNSQTYTMTPSTGYYIQNVLVDGASVGAVSSYTFTNVTAEHTISVSFALYTYTITASANSGGTISPSGVTTVNYGSSQAYTISPNTGYHIVNVLVDGVSQGAITTYTFTNVIANHTIAVTFAIDTFTITASAGTNGSISPNGDVPVNYGASQTFTMTPNAHYHVLEVLVDGASVGAVSSYTFTNVTANHTIAVRFAIDTYTISASAGANGTIDPIGAVVVNYGDNKNFSIAPNVGYHVVDVLVDGVSQGAITTYSFTNVTANHTIAATFAIDTHTITATAGSNGSISPSGVVTVNYGASQTFTITPNAHYHVLDVFVDDVSVGAVTSYTFNNVVTNHTIAARFAIDTYTITASAGANGSISPSGAVTVNYAGSQTFTITPDANYHVADVLVDGVSVGAVTSYTFNNVTANHTIAASFAIDTRTITASAGANGSISPSGVVTVNYGSSQAFTITPDAHYHIADVLVDGSSVGAVTTYTFNNVTANHTIVASFAIDTYTITASAGANGSISPSGAVTVNYNASQTFAITPDANYHVADVLVDGVSVGAVTSYTFSNVTANHTIAASFAIDTRTITASAGANGSISPSGAVVVNYGASQTFTITPNLHYHVADVLVDGSSVGAVTSYTFTNVTTNHTIAVSFAIDTYIITATAGANGSISPSGAVNVNYGANQTFTITPNAHYHVDNVIVDGVSQGSITSYTFTTVAADHTIAASFSIDTHTITTSAGANGSISPSGSVLVNYGANQTFSIIPNANYHVEDVLVDGVSVGAVTSYTFNNVTADHTIAASFVIDTRTITATAGANGSISPSGAVTVNYGSDQAFTITPNTHYHVEDVLVDGVSVGAVTSYTFTNVTANHTIAASFTIDTYTITATEGLHGVLSPSGSVTVAHGADQTFTITPDAHYHVADVLVDGASVGAVTSYTFTNVTANHTISASFAIDTHTITASAGVNGSISPAGAVSVDYGANQVFTITPNEHYHIADVVVDGASVGAVTTYTFNDVIANHTITASFAIDTYTIDASAGANGTISPSGNVSVNYGASQTFAMTPSANYHVADVLVDGVSVGAQTSYTFSSVAANHTISVTFAIDTHTIIATAVANGSISPNGTVIVNHGADQTFTMTPDSHYHVQEVMVDGVSVGAVTSYTFTNVAADHTIGVLFTIDTNIITATAGANGTIDPAGATSVDYGANQTFTITPNANYHVADVLVDGASVGAVTSYTFNNVTTAHTITASFAIDTYIIDASAGANGAISPSGNVTVNHGADQVFSITPSSHYHVLDVLVDGVSVGAVTSYTFTNVTVNHTISAAFTIDTNAITATAGSNGVISPSGTVDVNYGTDQTFNITPSEHYHVADVLVDGASVGAVSSYTFHSVTAAHTISATFAIDTVAITASAGANGTISPSGTVNVNYGANQAFTITPNANYHVADVLVDGASVGAVTSYSFNDVTATHTIAASFAIDTNTIIASASANGNISPAGAVSVDHGADKTFNITPDSNYHVLDVLVDGVSVGAVTSYTFTNVIAAHTIVASFALDTHVITTTAGDNGSISPQGAITVTNGSDQTFNITPNTHYHIADVLVDGVSVGAVSAYTFTNVTASHTITASFAITTHTITATAGANGFISPSGATAVIDGANQTFSIGGNPGYKVLDVVVDGSSVGAVTTYTFSNVTTDHTINATYIVDGTTTITVTQGANGTINPGTIVVPPGNDQTFTITPDAHYHIVAVLADGVSQGAITSYTFHNVHESHTITASYAKDIVAINASAGINGTISPTGVVDVEYGAAQTFTITPNTHYHVADVLVDGISVGAVTSYTFSNVTTTHTISASFAIDTVAITASAGANGTISPSGTVNVNYGANQAFTITPNANYHVADVLVDGVSVGAVTSYTFTDVMAVHTIAASFAIDTNTITASASANGSIVHLDQ